MAGWRRLSKELTGMSSTIISVSATVDVPEGPVAPLTPLTEELNGPGATGEETLPVVIAEPVE